MEQNQGFLQKYRNYLIGGVIIAAAIVYFAVQTQPPREEEGEGEQTTEQTNGEPAEADRPENGGPSDQNENQMTAPVETGNISIKGILRLSDDPSKGNLMMESDRGQVYIATGRDFSVLLDKEVTLIAQGMLESFIFLGFEEADGAVSGVDSGVGGPADELGMVALSGRLERSDDETRGNYLILSDSLKVYLKSQRDYSAWIGQEVELAAKGTIQSFTEARLSQK